ncbi:unnamed protein product [Fusarium equiseti]|uniref:F-box domain-containing protein n=1 Tax=Fusarium equiseti TaxID=61235 RepID=A0A8J2IKK5_FUSEQ|nr:unnamed protein product [Fusarium equiseti]
MVVTRSGKSTAAVTAKLPPEILYHIFQYFCSHCCNEYNWPFGPPPGSKEAQDTRTLLNLCRVSRSFRNVAQEILFHSFDPDYPRPSSRCNHWTRRLEPFLQTVAARPDLARSVKAVFLSRYLYENLDFWQSRKAFQDCVRALGKSLWKMFREVHKDSRSPVKQVFFLSHISLGAMDIWLPEIPPPASEKFFPELFSVLVAIVPNLAHLAISKSSSCRQMPRHWDVRPELLDFLGVDCISIKTIETHAPLENLLRRCPKLETCITDGWHDFPDMPTVKHLHLRHTDSLITLSCVNATDNLYEAIDIPRLHDSLEVLHLEARYLTPLPSLTKFDKLKYLFLDTHGIYGMVPVNQSPLYSQSVAKILPRNIVNLSVSSCFHTQDRWERDLCESLASEEDLFPALESVTSNEEISRKDLAELCDRLGLGWSHKDSGPQMDKSCQIFVGHFQVFGHKSLQAFLALITFLINGICEWSSTFQVNNLSC